MFDLKEELKNLPDQPGVYLMHDKSDTVIYVGKAKILKNRVRQYFRESSNHTPKVRAMMSHVEYFEYIVTDSEVEALVLECNLIKKYRPKYNILLKDDKQYPYLKVTINHEYPAIFKTRMLKNDGAKYFGPYMGANTIKNMLDIIQKIFHPPTCSRKFPQDIGKGRPCLNYHIKNCFAPCMGNVTAEEYRQVFYEICSFLEGDHKKLISELEEEMKKASDNMEFEKAAEIRDKIRSVRALGEKQKIVNSDAQTDLDIIALAMSDNKAFAEVFFVRMGKVTGRENYRIDQAEDMAPETVLSDFVKQFYVARTEIPPLILTETEIEDSAAISEMLSQKRGKKAEIISPKRGEKKKLMLMVKKNAEIAAENYKIAQLKEKEKSGTLMAFSEIIGLDKPAARIEAYDISNISGADNVSAMIVFENGKPANKKYRKFKIKAAAGGDDYASMQETLYRRFRHALEEEERIKEGTMNEAAAKFLPYPDVILIDGGKGHLRAALEIMGQMDIEIPAFGMVKDDKHRTRGLVSKDGEIGISGASPVFKFITRIQDEVHRSAISYHRSLHKKESVKSELDNISGIGSVRRQALLRRFKSVENIKNAEIEELETADGMTRSAAEAVWNYFRHGK